MNLFVLHADPVVSARMNCDKHVCKIILEAYQMMSLAHLNHGADFPWLWDARTHNNVARLGGWICCRATAPLTVLPLLPQSSTGGMKHDESSEP